MTINCISQYFSKVDVEKTHSNQMSLLVENISYVREHMVNPQLEIDKHKIIQNDEYRSNKMCEALHTN